MQDYKGPVAPCLRHPDIVPIVQPNGPEWWEVECQVMGCHMRMMLPVRSREMAVLMWNTAIMAMTPPEAKADVVVSGRTLSKQDIRGLMADLPVNDRGRGVLMAILSDMLVKADYAYSAADVDTEQKHHLCSLDEARNLAQLRHCHPAPPANSKGEKGEDQLTLAERLSTYEEMVRNGWQLVYYPIAEGNATVQPRWVFLDGQTKLQIEGRSFSGVFREGVELYLSGNRKTN